MATDDCRIGAVVLAAGASRRMGTNKSLLPIDGEPMLARVVGILRFVANPMVVVTGFEPDVAKAALGEHAAHVEFVFNCNHEAGGMLSSIKTGRAKSDRTLTRPSWCSVINHGSGNQHWRN